MEKALNFLFLLQILFNLENTESCVYSNSVLFDSFMKIAHMTFLYVALYQASCESHSWEAVRQNKEQKCRHTDSAQPVASVQHEETWKNLPRLKLCGDSYATLMLYGP